MSMLFDMKDFRYNDTFARLHKPHPAVQVPVQREFSLVYLDGWGPRDANSFVDEHLKYVRMSVGGVISVRSV